MTNTTETLEGWYCLNDFCKMDWMSIKSALMK